MQISNDEAKKLVKIFAKYKCLPVGSYGRSSNEESYKDLDFITFEPLNQIYKLISNDFDSIENVKLGNKYMNITLNNKYHIDLWYTTKKDFWKIYMTRTIESGKLIYINKFIKDNS